MKDFLRNLTTPVRHPHRGLLPLEWAVVAYTLLTLIIMLPLWSRLHDVAGMLQCRAQALLLMLVLWTVYRKVPCPLVHLVRVGSQIGMLGLWYPDTYELNRLFPNLDHHFAAAEQWLFGCQPALVFSERFTNPVLSELLSLGYVSYYPLIVAVLLYYFAKRYAQFNRAAFVVLTSFFLFYLIFIFLPVAGPQFYFQAVGTDRITAGVFPNLGHYFENHQECLPIPGWADGFMHQQVIIAHDAGERPTAAFPSSHVGITTVLLWLAWSARSRWLFWSLVPFAVLMFFATFYIQAHYAIDAVAGVLSGTLIYLLTERLYRRYFLMSKPMRSPS